MFYDACSECKRLIAVNPYANSYGCPDQYTIIEGRKVCWECTEKLITKLGVVPYRADTKSGGGKA